MPLHCAAYPTDRLPDTSTPENFLHAIMSRPDIGTQLSADALRVLEGMKDEVRNVCENLFDSQTAGLKWSIYQNSRTPELFVVVGKLGNREFANTEYNPEFADKVAVALLPHEKLRIFSTTIRHMKNLYLGLN